MAKGMTRTPHPLCSPDLARCGFFLFSCVKNQPLMAIKEIYESIEKAVSHKVFHKWRETLAKYLVGVAGW
jgi:hypothetical protein